MFVKLFTQILDSSIADNRKLRHFFTDLLLLADSKGYVVMTEEAIARRIGASVEEVKWGIDELCRPDQRSKSPDHEGRRLIKIGDGGYGWQILNYEAYRAMRDADQLREATKKRVRRHREKKRGVTQCNTPETQGNAITEEEAKAETKVSKRDLAKPESEQSVIDFCESRGLPKSDGTSIWNKWLGNGFKNGGNAIKDWRATIISWQGHGYLPSQKGGATTPQNSRFPTKEERYAEAVRKNPNHI